MWFLLWLVSVIGAAMALSRYNKAGSGFLLGVFLGPLGLIIALIWRSSLSQEETSRNLKQIAEAARAPEHDSRQERECPYCAEPILRKAKVCKHCGRDVEPLADPVFVPAMQRTGHCPYCSKPGIPLDAPVCPSCNKIFGGNPVVKPIPD